MRKIIILLLHFVLNFIVIHSVFPQSNPRHFFNVFAGETYNVTSALERDLRGNDFLGQDLKLNSFTETFGLGYNYIRTTGLVVGGSAYLFDVRSKTVNGQVNLRTANLFVNMGYCVVNKDRWIAYPYAGVGLTGTSFCVTNIAEHKDIIIYKDTINAGGKASFDAGGLAFDFGLSFKMNKSGLKNSPKKGIYPVIGMDIGSSLFPSLAYWLSHSRHDTILSLHSPFFIAPYLRLTVGIVKFSKKADHRIW